MKKPMSASSSRRGAVAAVGAGHDVVLAAPAREQGLVAGEQRP